MENETLTLGSQFANWPARASYLALGKRIIPPYPGNSVVPLSRPPAVSRFPWHLANDQQITHVLRMYASAGLMLYRAAPTVRVPPAAKTGMLVATFLSHAHALEVEPLVWLLHSLHRWTDAARPAPFPGYPWLFSLNRLQAQAAETWPLWDQLRPLLPAPTRQHTELLALWQQMDSALATELPDSVPKIEAVVSRFFPGDSYDKMVANAKASAIAEQRRMESLAREGQVFWTL